MFLFLVVLLLFFFVGSEQVVVEPLFNCLGKKLNFLETGKPGKRNHNLYFQISKSHINYWENFQVLPAISVIHLRFTRFLPPPLFIIHLRFSRFLRPHRWNFPRAGCFFVVVFLVAPELIGGPGVLPKMGKNQVVKRKKFWTVGRRVKVKGETTLWLLETCWKLRL